jgi:hypothetical protein
MAKQVSKKPVVPAVIKRAAEGDNRLRVVASVDPLDYWFALPPEQTDEDHLASVRMTGRQRRHQPLRHEVERVTEFRITLYRSAGNEAPYIGAEGVVVKNTKWAVDHVNDWQKMNEEEARHIVDAIMQEPQRQYRSGLLLQHEYRVSVERRVTIHEDVSCFFENAHLQNPN